MPKIKQLRKFFKKLFKAKIRLVATVGLVLFFFTIPSRLIYSFPPLEPKHPPSREVDLQIPEPDLYPINVTDEAAPYFSARSVIAVDVDSKAVIYMKNPDEKLLPASTTKMVTALVALDNYQLNQVASISSPLREGQIMELYEGEQITVNNLLHGLLVYSGNDAAYALAELDPNGIDGYVAKMNQKVIDLGLKETHFTNPTGLDNGNHYSSVHDLALIGAELISKPELAQIVQIQNEIVTDTSGEIVHELTTINELLGQVDGLKGIKTGWTDAAGECLVSYTERDGHKVITAVLGSYDRFGETRNLIEWVFGNHEWKKVTLPKEINP